jgi:serine/threonine protein kinase
MATKSWTTIHSGYELSPYTFKKRSRTATEYYAQPCGDVWFNTRHWKTERIINEAKALKLLAKRTRIPIPQFIRYGQNDNESMFLEISRVDGIDLSEAGKECRKPGGVRHNSGGECNKCMDIAKANAKHFIQTVLLPELAKLRSNETGLDGFVLPPAWMLEYDTRSHWDTKTSSYQEFVFTHGDLGPDNLRMDPNTLTVKCVIDWEHSGYFPPEFQKWSVDDGAYHALYEDHQTICELARSIEPVPQREQN